MASLDASMNGRISMPDVARAAARVAAIAAVVGFAGCSQTGPAYGPPTANTAATVAMSGFQFDPEVVRIKAGDTVEWRNTSSFTHSVNADPARFPDDVSIPAGTAPFDSGRLPPGQVFRHTFVTPGTYKYVCLPHVDFGMAGTVIVAPR
jgi:plastocyanin